VKLRRKLCGTCKKEVQPFAGALFSLNGVYYHVNCWPKEENIPVGWFRVGVGYISTMDNIEIPTIEDPNAIKVDSDGMIRFDSSRASA